MRKVLVILADAHSGHPYAVPPNPDGWTLFDGNFVATNPWQRVIYEHFIKSAEEVADLRRNAQLIVVHAGDPIEGYHHNTVELLTPRIDEQERMHVASMQNWLHVAKYNYRKDRQYFLTGTVAHGGIGNASVERIARALLRTDELDGAAMTPYILGLINGVLFDIAHKGFGLGSRDWTRTNSMRAYLTSEWYSNLKNGESMPRYVIRAHRHTYGHAALEDDNNTVVSEAFLMPAWKLKDEFVYTFAPQGVSSIGCLAFNVEDSGKSCAHPIIMRYRQDVRREL